MLIDAHAHLTDPYFDDKLDKVVNTARKNNFVAIITNGINLEDNKKILELCKKYDIVKAAIGFYPDEIIKSTFEEIEENLEFIKINKNKIVAIGEVGLDLHHNKNLNKQKEVFIKIIDQLIFDIKNASQCSIIIPRNTVMEMIRITMKVYHILALVLYCLKNLTKENQLLFW